MRSVYRATKAGQLTKTEVVTSLTNDELVELVTQLMSRVDALEALVKEQVEWLNTLRAEIEMAEYESSSPKKELVH